MPNKGPLSPALLLVVALAALGASGTLAPGAVLAAPPVPAPKPSPAATPAAAPKPVEPSGDVQAPADRTLVITLPDAVTVTLEPGTGGRRVPTGTLPSETN